MAFGPLTRALDKRPADAGFLFGGAFAVVGAATAATFGFGFKAIPKLGKSIAAMAAPTKSNAVLLNSMGYGMSGERAACLRCLVPAFVRAQNID